MNLWMYDRRWWTSVRFSKPPLWPLWPMEALQGYWLSGPLAMRTNRRSPKDLTRLLFAHAIRKKPRWYTVFLKSIDMLLATFAKDGSPSCTLGPIGLVHAAMPSLTSNARQQAAWLWQSMQNHQMALWYDNWVKKNYGVDPLPPDHSINCTVVAVLHLPVLPPFPDHVSLIHAAHTTGARVDALQLRHADLFLRVYALPHMIRPTFVTAPLDIVRQNVPSLRWQPMMLSQLRRGTKGDPLKLLNGMRHV